MQVDILTIAAGDNNIGNVDIVTLPNVTIGTMANLTESLVDDAAFTPATSRVLPIGFTFDDVTPDSVNEGDIGVARMSVNRNIYATLRDAAGNERGLNIDASGNIAVTQSGTWTVQPGNTANTTPWLASIHDGTTKATVRDLAANDALNVAIVDGSGNQITSFGGGTQYAVDTALGATPTGTLTVFKRDDALSTLTPIEDDAVEGRVDSTGAIWMRLATGTASIGTLAANSGVDIGDVTINNVSGASAVNIQDGGNSITVDGTVTANGTTASTATLTNVSGSASSVTLIASNANRLGAVFFNDASVNCYVKFGTTASSTSFTYLMIPKATVIITADILYTGIVTGRWVKATGNMRVTELTA